MNHQRLSAFIWSVADLLRGDYKPHEYGQVILPFTVLRRLDCVLVDTKAAVLEKIKAAGKGKVPPGPVLEKAAKQRFYNTSRLDLLAILDDPDHVRGNLYTYLKAFSPAARDIFERFDFFAQIDRLHKNNLLYMVTRRFAGVELHPRRVSNGQMGLAFEELIRKFAELSNETAGEHFTPRDVIRLMVNLVFIEDGDVLTAGNAVVRTIYDPTAGTGGMLSQAEEYLVEHNPQARLTLFGQELNDEAYAICKADMLIKGQDVGNIVPGNTLSDDGHAGRKFDYMLANPPYGVEWKKVETVVRREHECRGFDGRFGPGLPRISDGSLLFLLHMVSKMRPKKDGGARIREAFAGPDYNLLLVANKYQTGFDQPLLCGMYIDRRLAGVQAVQTLSRLNRAHPGKDTTFVLDFVDNEAEILAAFRQYYDRAEMEAAADPNRIFDLRAKLDAQGWYDDHEIERVVNAELNPRSRQTDLAAAVWPVADRLLKAYKSAQEERRAAEERHDTEVAQVAKDSLSAFVLFKGDMGVFIRLYTFLSQLFDYGDTDVEKRFIFFKRLMPLLDFGRERDEIDLSKIVLTHHHLKTGGRRTLDPGAGEAEKLKPPGDAGTGQVQDKEKARLGEIIDKVNSLFEGELTENDKVTFIKDVLKNKLLENRTLRQQAASNTKEQFASSPDLSGAVVAAIMENMDAHENMGTQALHSPRVLEGIIDLLLGPLQLYDDLKGASAGN